VALHGQCALRISHKSASVCFEFQQHTFRVESRRSQRTELRKASRKKESIVLFFFSASSLFAGFFILLLRIRRVFLEAVSVLKLISHISTLFGL